MRNSFHVACAAFRIPSGALTSWTMVNKPGLFAAGYASSAVVEAILDFWQYFEPERLFMAANCSADVEAVISHIDQVHTLLPPSVSRH